VGEPDWPSFSIVMPTYQRRDVVCEAVRALARVDYPGAVELLVVVDGSTDRTADALAAIACPFPVEVIVQENAGAAAARNRGAAEAANDVILFLDDDMICEPKLLREHGRLYGSGADAVIGNTPIDPESPSGFLADSIERWIASAQVRMPLSPFDIFTGQLSVRRSLFEQLGGFDNALTSGAAFGSEDADFGARLLLAHDVRHNPSAISFQRYVVAPQEYSSRAERAAAAHVQFVRKHPQLARELFERRGVNQPLVRWVYRPLSRIPFLPRLIRSLAIRAAEGALRTRFRSNRLLARFFSGACSLTYWTELRRRGWFPFSKSLLVLCYHAIRDEEEDPVLARFTVAPRGFEQQLDSLRERGFTFISPTQLLAFVESKAPLPRRPVLLTFDDGYTELPSVARELLRPRGIEAIAFIVTGTASNDWDQAYGVRPVDLLTREELKSLGELGIEIGSHSRTHGEMHLMDDAERDAEAAGSIEDMAVGGLPRPRFFAYPYGATNAEARGTVRSAGFRAGFGLIQSRLYGASDRFNLPRVIILGADGRWRFRAKTSAPRLFNLFVRARRTLGLLFG
jgi:glycosyltransferase involved in cell wall biosynthesis/peptidoglycan/xylan/chitin deacetylase (PgdA/CDA1 family)